MSKINSKKRYKKFKRKGKTYKRKGKTYKRKGKTYKRKGKTYKRKGKTYKRKGKASMNLVRPRKPTVPDIFDAEIKTLREVGIEPTTSNCYLLRSNNPEIVRLIERKRIPIERKRMTQGLDMKYDNIPLTDFIEPPQILLEPGQEPEPGREPEPEPELDQEPEPEQEQSHELEPEPEHETGNFSEILTSMRDKTVAVVIGINHSGDDKDSERYLNPEGGSTFVPENCNILYIQPPNCPSSWKVKGGNDMSEDLYYGLVDINVLEILDKYKSCNFERNDECVYKFMGEIGEAGFHIRWKLNGIPSKEKFKITDKMTPQYYSPGEKLTDLLYDNEGRLELLFVINGVYISIDIRELFRATGVALIPGCEFKLSEIVDRFFIYLDNEFNFRKNKNKLIVSMASCRS